jgi:diguanylate cyclase (GGDEF)-like protein
MPLSHLAYHQIADLQRMYLDSLTDKHSEITTCWLSAEHQNWQPETIEKLRAILLRLASSAISYGFTDISAAAHQAKYCLRQTPLTQDNLLDLHHTLQSLCSLLTVYAREEVSFQSIVPDNWEQIVATNNQILLIDNKNPQTEQLIQQLEQDGHIVHFFSSLITLEKSIDRIHPYVVLFDVLSITNYISEFEQLAQLLTRHLSKIPMIFFSAHDDFAIRLQATRAGAQVYFAKPVTATKLLNYLGERLTLNNHAFYRVLLLTDDADIANLHQVIFKQTQIDTLFVHTQEAVISALVAFEPEVILIDLCLPSFNGISLATLLRQEPAYFSIPILFLVTNTEEIEQLTYLQVGGEDYLVKPVAVDYLIQLIKTRARYFRQLNSLIGYDGLTGFLNYATFSQRLMATLATAERSGSAITIAVIDIDNFKGVNQQYGYWIGNRVLKQVAKTIKQRLRRGDLLGRYKSDKFVIALHDADLISAQKILTALIKTLSDETYNVNETEFHVTFGVGITDFPGHDPALKEANYDIVETAIQALRTAKQKGSQQIATVSLTDLFF